MASRQQALKAIEQAGGTVDWDVSYMLKDQKSICIDAPEGYYWDRSQAECISIRWECGPASEFWDEVIERVSEGLTAA